jgi:glutamine kinase
MSYSFLSKAGTLNLLQGKLRNAKVVPLVFFTVSDWQSDHFSCLQSVNELLGSGPWIVRSSCQREDTEISSNAGNFLSLLNITQENLQSSIDEVINSYNTLHQSDEVLVQPMLKDVVRSGVAFSHDPNTCSPYRVINWYEGTDTTQITGGGEGKCWQQAALSPVEPPDKLVPILNLLEELLLVFKGKPIDIEFAITDNKTLWLLQVRPLLLNRQAESNEEQQQRIGRIYTKIKRGMTQHPFLMGQSTSYGVMPDWNPAEIIGIRPRPLALSLYRELVTDSIWAYQRHNYGYRNLRSFPLMPHFFGLPYIDLRLSFNSFIPADLDEGLANRLVDYYISMLNKQPTLHDKVEFEIVFSCYTIDLPERIKRLDDIGFTRDEKKELSDSLRKLTNRIVHPHNGLWKSDAAKLDTLNKRREEILSSSVAPIERIYWLLEDAKRYGTLPFAGLARAGFVAVQILQSLISVGVLSKDDYDSFLNGIKTVSKQLSQDRGNLDQVAFLAKYGHLRPGTYDILSPRYDEAPDLYFEWNEQSLASAPEKPFSLTLTQMRELVKLLKSHGLHPDPVGLFDFLQAGIELRELAKFHFTRNLSDAISLIGKYGENYGFSREELAFCNVTIFRELHVAALDPVGVIQQSIDLGKVQYKDSLATSLPPLISEPDDVWGFEHPETAPNYITQKQISAEVRVNLEKDRLSGAIICIPNADPGFDWLFSYKIAGLITAWGGVNSHMAIRAGEIGLPSVIGVGETLYREYSSAQSLFIDCANRQVKVLA